MPDPDPRAPDDDDSQDATNHGRSSDAPVEGADDAPGRDAGSPAG